jgi:hypothetical protein
MSGRLLMNVPFFFPSEEKRRTRSFFRSATQIAVGADGEAGGGVELSVDHHARLELAARRRRRQVLCEDAAGARGADVERLAVQDQVHGRLEHPPCDVGQQFPGLHIEDLHCVAGFVRHVQILPVYDDPAHRVAWLAVLVEHHLEAQRRWHIERRALTVLGETPVAGRDERAGENFPLGYCLRRCAATGAGSRVSGTSDTTVLVSWQEM